MHEISGKHEDFEKNNDKDGEFIKHGVRLIIFLIYSIGPSEDGSYCVCISA